MKLGRTVLTWCCFALFGLSAGMSGADSMVVKGTEHGGSFESYKDEKFTFRTDAGELLNKPRRWVSELKLDKPLEVTLERSDEKGRIPALLKGFSANRFALEVDGKEKNLLAYSVREIRAPSAGGSAGTAGDASDTPAALTTYDVSAFAARPDLTDRQSAVLNRYEKARNRYESFIDENARLVRQMDAAKGGSREELLNELRLRKDQEQPIKQEMQSATAALLAVFPAVTAGGGEEDGVAEPGQGELISGGAFVMVLFDFQGGADIDAKTLAVEMKKLSLFRYMGPDAASRAMLPGHVFAGFVGEKDRAVAQKNVSEKVSGIMRKLEVGGTFFVIASADVDWSYGGVSIRAETKDLR